MKHLTVGLTILLALAASVQAQQTGTVTLKIDVGLLEEADGVTPVPMGGLLQLIASPSGDFSAPTSSSYVTGDNVLITLNGASPFFVTNYQQSQTTGETINTINFSLSTSNYTLTPGEPILLRFYPSLTLASASSPPPAGTSYGQVRSNTTETFQSGTDPTQIAWGLPGAGATNDLDYITVDDGGVPNGTTYTNATAFATNVVLPAIPEPSTRATLGAGLAGLLGLAAWRRRRGVLA